MDKMLKIAVLLTAVDKMSATIKSAVGKSQKELEDFRKKQDALFAKGAASTATGVAILAGVKPAIDAYASLEEAQAQLKVSIMQEGGAVSDLMDQYDKLANQLGNTLPGDTEKFYNMLAVLKQQGISDKAILGGLGEAAAKASVVMKMEANEAAIFMAKMQDATKTAESDMLRMADVLQRGFFFGVKSDDQMQFFSKLAPALQLARMEGQQAVEAFAPLMVMFDQSAMRGEAAGNAMRKVIQAGMDQSKVAAASAIAGTNLSFTDASGNFAGFGNMIAQIEKLKNLSDTQKMGVMKKLFGDDAETLQVVNILMNKGIKGYNDMSREMARQATLEQRLSIIKQTINSKLDNMWGNFKNLLAIMGGGIAPVISLVADMFAVFAGWLQTVVAEYPGIAKFFAMFAVGVSILYTVTGAVTLLKGAMSALNLVMGNNPFIKFAIIAIAVVSLIYANWGHIVNFFKWLWGEVKKSFHNFWVAVKAIFWTYNPVVLIYNNWDKIVAWFGNLWERVKVKFMQFVEWVFELPAKIYQAGVKIVESLWDGIQAKWGEFKSWWGSKVQEIRDFLPFSPAKVGPLKDIHKIKLVETIAEGIKPAAMLQKMQQLGQAVFSFSPAGGGGGAMQFAGVGGGGVTVNMNINVSGGATPAAANAFVAELRKNKSEIARIIEEAMKQKERRSF